MGREGFTLIEVLIVVVIIAVLAALILPRILLQSEKALLAEAYQILGAMTRAQTNHMGLRDSGSFIALDSTNATNWDTVGLSPPEAKHFIYSCAAVVNNCVATRWDPDSAYHGSTITLESDGRYFCTGNYAPIEPDASNYSRKGCTT